MCVTELPGSPVAVVPSPKFHCTDRRSGTTSPSVDVSVKLNVPQFAPCCGSTVKAGWGGAASTTAAATSAATSMAGAIRRFKIREDRFI